MVTQPLQQQGDLSLQDVEDDHEDLGPAEAASSQESHVHTGISQQLQGLVAHDRMKPIRHSAVKDGIKAWVGSHHVLCLITASELPHTM